MSNLELVAINLTAEYMSLNSELQLFRCSKGTYLEPMIERSIYIQTGVKNRLITSKLSHND